MAAGSISAFATKEETRTGEEQRIALGDGSKSSRCIEGGNGEAIFIEMVEVPLEPAAGQGKGDEGSAQGERMDDEQLWADEKVPYYDTPAIKRELAAIVSMAWPISATGGLQIMFVRPFWRGIPHLHRSHDRLHPAQGAMNMHTLLPFSLLSLDSRPCTAFQHLTLSLHVLVLPTVVGRMPRPTCFPLVRANSESMCLPGL